MIRIALTGGIASGKSTVSRILASWDVPLVDADQLCREVMAPGTQATLEIARRWPEVMDPGGIINRRRLGRILFADSEALREESAIVLPAIQRAFFDWASACERAGERLCVYDAALVFENGLEKDFDGVLLVSASLGTQVSRVMSRDGLSREEALGRIRSQMPLSEKERRATWIIRNDGTEDELKRKLGDEVWPMVLKSCGVSSDG